MILVTGGSGFLGQHLVRYLSGQGLQVRALYNAHAPKEDLRSLPGIEWQRADLLDIYEVEEAMAGVTHVYHCAAMVTFDPALRDKMLHFNPESTANIVNQALEQGVEKMVYVSSVAALGRNGENTKQITEEEEWGESKYNSAYGLSKYLAEMEVWRGIGEGLDAVIINPGIILGSGDWDSSSAQLIKLAAKEFPFYTAGVNGWTDVMDVVRIMTMLMASDVEAERFIVSAGNYSFREVFEMMAGALDKKPPRYNAGKLMTGLVWRLSTLQNKLFGAKTLITRETANNAQSISEYDNQKLLKAFPSFAYTPLQESIGTMARSFLQTK